MAASGRPAAPSAASTLGCCTPPPAPVSCLFLAAADARRLTESIAFLSADSSPAKCVLVIKRSRSLSVLKVIRLRFLLANYRCFLTTRILFAPIQRCLPVTERIGHSFHDDVSVR
ncbi:Hypothetical predicted protein [Cloeon dipterum]|uniref:Uncharacterized protein n=1 Tax=Cloeon dipterum TaxID=197152 RepID=A0A8S1CBB5_9INSE|nr:Hypothetical predicted protein [Cloeon dipterum]